MVLFLNSYQIAIKVYFVTMSNLISYTTTSEIFLTFLLTTLRPNQYPYYALLYGQTVCITRILTFYIDSLNLSTRKTNGALSQLIVNHF